MAYAVYTLLLFWFSHYHLPFYVSYNDHSLCNLDSLLVHNRYHFLPQNFHHCVDWILDYFDYIHCTTVNFVDLDNHEGCLRNTDGTAHE